MSARLTMQRFTEIGKKIVAVGRNYSEHAKELGNAVPTEPVIFLKPTSSYIAEGANIVLPPNASSLHHEVELGVIIGSKCKHLKQSEVDSIIAGYALALDMTDRQKQTELKNKGLPWSVAKGFDTSCPVGRFLEKTEVPDPHQLELWCKVNGEMRQSGNTKDMIFTIPQLLVHISSIFTLEPGDLVLTGTPSGVGPVKSGDVIEAGIGNLTEFKFEVE